MSISKFDLPINPPLMNAAGMLGFIPDSPGASPQKHQGAFLSNPISIKARTPTHSTRMITFPGGLLLHTGHPNPGLRTAIRSYGKHWSRSSIPVIIHILATSVEEVSEMVKILETIEGIMGVELGLPPDIATDTAQRFIEAALGELPLFVRVPVDRASEMVTGFGGTGFAAISLGPPRGALPDPSGRIVHGRLYGPALFPLALAAVRTLTRMDIPVIGAGGIYHPQNIQTMLEAGAIAVQLDTVLWRGGIDYPAYDHHEQSVP